MLTTWSVGTSDTRKNLPIAIWPIDSLTPFRPRFTLGSYLLSEIARLELIFDDVKFFAIEIFNNQGNYFMGINSRAGF